MRNARSVAGVAALLAGALPMSACARPGPDREAQRSAGTPQPASPGSSSPAPTGSGENAGAGLTLRRFEQRREQHMLAADIDHDGKVSRAEFMAAASGGKGDPARRFARLDANGDGDIDRQEIDAAAARRFGRLDADGDGLVSRQERRSGTGAASARPGRAAADDAG